MTVREGGGDMYSYVDYTVNPVRGRCPNQCPYCYVEKMKQWAPAVREKYSGPITLDRDELGLTWYRDEKNRTVDLPFLSNTLGDQYVWFPCSCHDLGCVPQDLQKVVYDKMRQTDIAVAQEQKQLNLWIIQSKRPGNLVYQEFPVYTLVLTTVETNRDPPGQAPHPRQRIHNLAEIPDHRTWYKGVTLEPIMDFDVSKIVEYLDIVEPDLVTFGADSKGNDLDEPPQWKIDRVERYITRRDLGYIVEKPNLTRLV